MLSIDFNAVASHHRERTFIAIKALYGVRSVLSKAQLGQRQARHLPESLGLFGRVDIGQTNLEWRPVAQDREGVTIGNADNPVGPRRQGERE